MTAGFSPFAPANDGRYGNGRHSGLPWGYWLTSIGNVAGEPPLIDEDGRQWNSVREAFWVDRLGLPKALDSLINSVLGFMASYLAIIDRRFVPPQESVKDVFLGDHSLDLFFKAHMNALGFVDGRFGGLTPEGRAVLLMLLATRTFDDAQVDVGIEWIDADRTMAPPAERASVADLVGRSEAVASKMAHRFVVDTIEREPAIKLIALRITPEVPVRSTVWTMTWPDRDSYARDRFYLWLLERIDRWDDWSEMVREHSARALTEHLMRLAFCDRFAGASGFREGGE